MNDEDIVFHIFHREPMLFTVNIDMDRIEEDIKQNNFVYVGAIYSTPKDVYRDSQNFSNPEYEKLGVRSTSAGDIILGNIIPNVCKGVVIDGVGYKHLTDEQINQLSNLI